MSESEVAISDLLERLGSKERSEQRRACDEATQRLQKDPEFQWVLRDLLRDGSRLARFATAFVLFPFERPGMRLLPALLDALDLEEGDIRWQATHMLATLGRMQGEALPVLLHECRHAESAVRRRMSLYAVRELAPERTETAEALMGALSDGDAEVRRAALTCFAKLIEPDRSVLDRVLEIARDPADLRMARIATVVLPDLVGHHPEALGEVEALVSDLTRSDDASLARAAQTAAHRIEPGSAHGA